MRSSWRVSGSWAAVVVAALVLTASAVLGQIPVRKLEFRDEFNKPAGTPVDSSKWTLENGGWGWGNAELQYYRNSTENAFHDGAGSLVIKAIKETLPLTLNCWYGPCQYTSARMITKGKFDITYGRFEARITITRGQGMWPAFWLLGSDIDTVGWPACGEVDIMENIGREPTIVHGGIHGPGYSGGQSVGGQTSSPVPYADGFHVYAIEWTPTGIRWMVDGVTYQTKTAANLPQGTEWVFDHPFFIILNVAVGGNWPGSPDGTTVFPQEMLIDYVRVSYKSS